MGSATRLTVNQSSNEFFVFHFEYHEALRVRRCKWENQILETLGGPKSPPDQLADFLAARLAFFLLPFPVDYDGLESLENKGFLSGIYNTRLNPKRFRPLRVWRSHNEMGFFTRINLVHD
jgi:hypothetical protein